jgi:CheY-like chemotaxis protein
VLTVNTKERVESGRGPGLATRRRAVSILHAEDGPEVSEAVRDLLEAEGWHVHVCRRGDEALRELQGGAPFDLLIFDHMLPGLNGVELTRRARSLSSRRRTPVIMLTASEVEREARVAGVDVFLRKPEGVTAITEAAARLLAASAAAGGAR